MKLLNNDAKQNSRLFNLPAALGLAAFLLAGAEARAVNFSGNGNTGFGGPIGNGTLTLTDDGTTISATLTLGGSIGNNGLVIYVDNGMGGGFSSTSGFNDQTDQNHIIISGVDGTDRSVMTFMSGFNPQYAISLIPNNGFTFGGIWKLANGNNGSMTYVDTVNLSPSGSSTGPYTFSFPASDLGLTPGSKTTINIFGTLISTTAYRSTEAIAGNDTGPAQGEFPYTQTADASYTFDAGAPTLTPVYFQVDMTEQIANGNFHPPPGGSDVVNVAGSFQTTPWSGFALTNNPAAANPNIYSGTYQDENPAGTGEQYKFNINQATWEASDNRLFTLQSGGQSTPLVYFSDLWLSPSATINPVTFQIDMTSAIEQGNFNPATESIEVFGTPESPAQWSPGFILATNPPPANPNLFVGTTNDGNYPGTWEQYKYVIVSNGSDNYESIANRDFTTPTGAGTLPVAYFNNVENLQSISVTFQVDMSSQVEAGIVNPGAGATVGVAGNFQSPAWSGALLTNDPNAANTNVFSGTFVITGQPGAVYQYLFIINTTPTTYESPASTEGNNRVFILASSSPQTLPLVFWGDEDASQFLPATTSITFTVDMTNAVDETGVAFNPNTDDVVIAGSFTSPSWLFNWTDQFPGLDTPDSEYILANINYPGELYSGTYSVPAGSQDQVYYKYGIYHNAGSLNTGTLDNEAPYGENHSRYIRTTGNYVFPTDVFGQQTNSNPAIAAEASEISFGNLAISSPSPGTIGLTWLGRPGVYLQTNTDLTSGTWTTLPASGGGMSASNFPASNGKVFFRLVNP